MYPFPIRSPAATPTRSVLQPPDPTWADWTKGPCAVLSCAYRSGMDERTFAVTLIRPGPTLPYFEVGAYRYTAEWLPVVGDMIEITRAVVADGEEPEMLRAYVTRVRPASDTPISATPLKGSATQSQDFLAA